MALMTRDEYIACQGRMKKRAFIMGQEVENPVEHPLVRPSLNACAMTYELARQTWWTPGWRSFKPIPGSLIFR